MFEIEPIGTESESRINELASLIGAVALDKNEAEEIYRFLEKAVTILGQSATTVSVVGQVKSGKSSLINALSGLGDFLPTEVNPWTAVITNVHFGHIDQPDSGAVFQLFSEQEWKLMIEGDPDSRRLAEELLPGFKSEVLQQQILDMQASARKRLGSLYHLLLGKKHRFNDVTPEILERYVSAGYGDDHAGEMTAGRFSGITKSADVYLPAGPFRVPVTLSDTPGINDPFLVRDALTTASFKDADIFISAISVHQALGPADIALLKMLATHTGKKTIIFVNRIDELDDPSKVATELMPMLDRRLHEEMDNPTYIMMSGSAHWGRVAAMGSDEQVAAALASPSYQALVASLGGDDESADPRSRLYSVSGMPELAACISDLIRDGNMHVALGKAANEVHAAFELLIKVLRDRVQREGHGLVDASQVDKLIEIEKERLEARVNQIEAAVSELNDILNDAQTEILKNGDVVFMSIRNAIDAAVNSFVNTQSHNLREALSSDQGTASWQVDIEPFCRRVEAQVAKAYQVGRAQVDRTLDRHAKQMSERISPFVGELPMTGLLRNLPFDEIFPTFKPRTLLVEMELKASRGWQFWRARTMSGDEAAHKLEQLIAVEVRAAEEDLRSTAMDAISARNAEAMSRLRTYLKSASDMLSSEATSLRRESGDLGRADARERIAEIYEERKLRAIELEQRADEIASAQTALLARFADVLVDVEADEPADMDDDRALVGALETSV